MSHFPNSEFERQWVCILTFVLLTYGYLHVQSEVSHPPNRSPTSLIHISVLQNRVNSSVMIYEY